MSAHNLALNPNNHLDEIVSNALRAFEDGVQRWRDVDIAEWLGLERPVDVRQVIRNNESELERHGIICRKQIIHGGAGRPGEEYWLNFEQAMVVCTLSRTPRAEDVRTAMIRVVSAVRAGTLAPQDGPTAQLVVKIDKLADSIGSLTLGVTTKLLQHDERFDRVEERFNQVDERFDSLEGRGRRGPSVDTVRLHEDVLAFAYDSKCPNCGESTMLDSEGHKTSDAECDHANGNRSDNRPQNLWHICKRCHKDKGRSTMGEWRPRFEAFQQLCKLRDPKSKQGKFRFN